MCMGAVAYVKDNVLHYVYVLSSDISTSKYLHNLWVFPILFIFEFFVP